MSPKITRNRRPKDAPPTEKEVDVEVEVKVDVKEEVTDEEEIVPDTVCRFCLDEAPPLAPLPCHCKAARMHPDCYQKVLRRACNSVTLRYMREHPNANIDNIGAPYTCTVCRHVTVYRPIIKSVDYYHLMCVCLDFLGKFLLTYISDWCLPQLVVAYCVYGLPFVYSRILVLTCKSLANALICLSFMYLASGPGVLNIRLRPFQMTTSLLTCAFEAAWFSWPDTLNAESVVLYFISVIAWLASFLLIGISMFGLHNALKAAKNRLRTIERYELVGAEPH